jgi:hypothetical protein
MLDFAHWLSKSFGTGVLASDTVLLTAVLLSVCLTIIFLTRIAMGVRFERVAGQDCTKMNESLDRVQLQLQTISQAFAFQVIEHRLELQRLNYAINNFPDFDLAA